MTSTKQIINNYCQLRLINRITTYRLDVWIKQIFTNFTPSARVSTLMPFNDRYLILYGGQNSLQSQTYKQSSNSLVWLYNTFDIKWTLVKLKGSQVVCQEKMTVLCIYEKIYIFGGINMNSQITKDRSIKGFSIQSKALEAINKEISKQENLQFQQGFRYCYQCEETRNKLSLKFEKRQQFQVFKESISEGLSYPFSAIGLLVDNSLLTKSTFCHISFYHTFKQKYIMIEDNGCTEQFWVNTPQFIRDMLIWRTNVEEDIDVLQESKENNEEEHHYKSILNEDIDRESIEFKEIREREDKQMQEDKIIRKERDQAKRNFRKIQEQRKQLSRNIKNGALRLGNKMLYFNKYGPNHQNKRVFVIERAEDKQVKYHIYYYVMEYGLIVDSSMEPAKKYVEDQYKAFLKLFTDKKQAKSFLVIGDLNYIQTSYGTTELQLKDFPKINDVLYTEKKTLEALQEGGYIIADMIDISLRAYLSLHFLKNQTMMISLSVGEHKFQQISSHQIFDKIDTLSKAQNIMDLQKAFDFQSCNIVEVYYNHNINKKNFTFHNGVLFYLKNRLISRYKFPLGELIKLNKHRLKGKSNNFLKLFGFVQLVDQFEINIFKTKFLREDLMDNIFNRLKFVEIYAEKNSENQLLNQKVRKLQNRQERHKYLKKLKPNEEIAAKSDEKESQKKEKKKNSDVIDLN